MHKHTPLIIGGATASGKSNYALELAEKLAGAIINGDSMQVYRELPILTAQPSLQERGAVHHSLYGVLPGDDLCSAARWRSMALEQLKHCEAMNLKPILVGGTGLYFLALTRGLAYIPDVEPEIRQAARDLFAEGGAEAFYRRVLELDPLVQDRLNPSDQQRLVRAYEVKLSTGTSIFEWQSNPPVDPGLECEMLVVERSRESLHRRATLRFDQMLEMGAIEEVQALLEKSYHPDLPVMRALGVRELAAYTSNEFTLDQARELAVTATRQYIKRQSTFFRNQFPKAERVALPD